RGGGPSGSPILTLAPSAPRVVSPWPGFGEKRAFAGMADTAIAGATHPALEPPDPWVAAGPNHVVQVVNRRIRVSSRQGDQLLNVSLPAFFAEPVTQVIDGDARVVYDSAHRRWVASE